MRLPRDWSGAALIQRLGKMGYVPTRQSGSHVRPTSMVQNEHHITIPLHDPLRIGTLSAILAAAAAHLGIDRDILLERLLD